MTKKTNFASVALVTLAQFSSGKNGRMAGTRFFTGKGIRKVPIAAEWSCKRKFGNGEAAIGIDSDQTLLAGGGVKDFLPPARFDSMRRLSLFRLVQNGVVLDPARAFPG
ncbi:MAG: hypothetical protein ACXWSR_14080 [Bdellovibrionota bacterium]